MSELATGSPAPSAALAGVPAGWRTRRRERQRLQRQDELSAHRAELHHIRAIALDARRVVDAGWLRGGWFGYREGDVLRVAASAHAAGRFGDRPIDAACLVGAVVQAGGGLAAAGSQPVQRALDLTWHTLFGDGREPVRWCPPPAVRARHVRELTRWNDDPQRTRRQVGELLDRVAAAAGAQLAATR